MRCPICKGEIPGLVCDRCGGESPEEAKYCMHCGEPLVEGAVDSGDIEDEFDIENRILCPDGSCTGIIVDGKCTECGRPYKEGEEGD